MLNFERKNYVKIGFHVQFVSDFFGSDDNVKQENAVRQETNEEEYHHSSQL